MAGLTPAKAKLILKEGQIGGTPITKKQKGFFGARAGGAPIKEQLSALKKKIK